MTCTEIQSSRFKRLSHPGVTRFCIVNKLPGDVDAGRPRTEDENILLYSGSCVVESKLLPSTPHPWWRITDLVQCCHFTTGETEVLKEEVTCPKRHSRSTAEARQDASILSFR